jgi:hypothetical protein
VARRLLLAPGMRHTLATILITLAAWTASAGATTSPIDTLYGDFVLLPGQQLVAASCYWRLVFQYDGNLVLYHANGTARWATGTNGSGAAYAMMQADGNLVLYRSDGSPVWATGTDGNYNAYVIIQDDGNIVIYPGWDDSHWFPIWASGTNGPWDYTNSYCAASSVTHVERDTNRYGGDYLGYDLYSNLPMDCAHDCAVDGLCGTYTYVPPGIQGPYAKCWRKHLFPSTSYAPGLVSGFISRNDAHYR